MSLGLKATKLREEKPSESTRGSYKPIGFYNNGLKHRPIMVRKLLKLAPMVGLVLGAAILMALHHFSYAYLNQKRIDPGSTELPPLLRSQRNVNVIGTTIAHSARIMLSTAIGATFVQMLWETLRSRCLSMAQIDALVRCGQSPFHPSVFRAVSASLALSVVSIATSATALVVILSPASLTVNSNFDRRISCSVPKVPQDAVLPSSLAEDNSTLYAFGLQESVLPSILATNSYLPIQSSLPTTCGDTANSCSYNISFAGYTMQCADITNKTNFTAFLNPIYVPSDQAQLIWDGTQTEYGILILSRDLEKDLLQATNCTVFNATYEVGVSLQRNFAASAEVWNSTTESAMDLDLSITSTFFDTFVRFAITEIAAVCYATLESSSPACIPSSFFAMTPSGNSTFGDTVARFAESYIQNVTISLLSGKIYNGNSNNSETSLETTQTTCSLTVAVYVYDPVRLIVVYAAAITVTTIIMSYGCALICRNNVEQNLLLSDLIRKALNEDMPFSREDEKSRISDKTQIQVSGVDDSNPNVTAMSFRQIPHPPLFEELPAYSFFTRRFASARTNMLLFIFSTAGCMVLNHAYYLYLDGREPSPPLRLPISSKWTLNQTIASGVGVGLAYTGQTLLAVAISNSCAQIFWRAVRQRKHTVADVDALIKAQANPLNVSMFSALRASVVFYLAILFAASTTLISILAPGSIRINSMHNQLKDCTIQSPRNLSALPINTTEYFSLGDNIGVIRTVMLSGTYEPPMSNCGPSYSTSHCSYSVEVVGPGLDCKDVTMFSNSTTFASFESSLPVSPVIWAADFSVAPDDGTLQMSVQTFDVRRSEYQAVNCTAVLRSYSISISHAATSTTNVSNSRILTELAVNIMQPVTFMDTYFQDIVSLLNLSRLPTQSFTAEQYSHSLSLSPYSKIGSLQLDGNVSWSPNMPLALEEFVQDSTLSILSGQVSPLNPNVPDILENVTTTCTYTFTAYEYSPRRLFLTYGVGISVTVLCAIWGSVAISRNGVDETMDFSRFLRAVLNERMYNARDILDKDTVIKADDTVEGAFAPVGTSDT